MKLVGCLLACVALLTTSRVPVQAEAQAQAPPRLTQAQAIQAAQAFCRGVGVATRSPVEVKYPVVDAVPESPVSWQSRWRVAFSNQVEVQVIDATGLVCDFRDYGLNNAIAAKSPPGDAIPKAEAIKKASILMRACGQMGELGTPDASETQPSDPPTWEGHWWIVSFPRVYGSISYKDQYANILLQAETGEPIGFTIRFSSPPLSPAPIRVDRAGAVTFASSLIANSLAAGAVLDKARLEIVQPNTFWLPDGSEEQKVGSVRLAQVVSFKAGTDTVEVWLDAATGEVLGGSDIGLLSGANGPVKPAKPQLAIKDALRSAREVRVYRKNSDGGWHLAPFLILNRQAQAKTFEALKSAKQDPTVHTLPGLEGDKVVTISSSGILSEYESAGADIGSGEQWVHMPADLQRLLTKTQ